MFICIHDWTIVGPWRHWEIYWREVFFNAFSALYRQRGDENSWDFNRISILISHLPVQVSQLVLAQGRRDPRRGRGGRRHRAREADDSLELLQVAENGRYKVVAKAEPYKNLPVKTYKIQTCLHAAAAGSQLVAICEEEIPIRKYKWIFTWQWLQNIEQPGWSVRNIFALFSKIFLDSKQKLKNIPYYNLVQRKTLSHPQKYFN